MVENIVDLVKSDGMDLVEMPELLVNQNVNKKKQILFVCTGNTCRSPMAAAVFNARYAGEEWQAVSAGLAADGAGISRNAVLALSEAGIPSQPGNDYRTHVSHTVAEADIARAELVVGITNRHAMSLLFAFPEAAGKITALPQDIEDPFGGDAAVYRLCLTQIQQALAEMFVENHEENRGNSDPSKPG